MEERIKQLRKELGLTQAKFGEAIGVKSNTIATYEMGRNPPSTTVITLICRKFNVNELWLRTGEGPMFVEPTPDSNLERLIGEVLADKPDNVKRAALEIFAGLDDDGWNAMYTIIKKLRGE